MAREFLNPAPTDWPEPKSMISEINLGDPPPIARTAKGDNIANLEI